MESGEEWIYRARDYAESERIKIVTIVPTKRRPRVEIEFLDGAKRGVVETVPSLRLRGPWSTVTDYDASQANWLSIEGTKLSEVEDIALHTVFEQLIPETVAELVWSPVQNAVSVHDRRELGQITGGVVLSDLRGQVIQFEDGTDLVLSPIGSMIIAEAACRTSPQVILDWVVSEELKQQKLVTEGEDFTSILDGQEYHWSPQQKYRHYLERYRPVHELLRQWCGYAAVTSQERTDAAEAEIGRLNDLISEAIAEIKSHGNHSYAEQLEQEFHEDRITSWNIRPIVQRPLEPYEMPTRHIERKRNWPR